MEFIDVTIRESVYLKRGMTEEKAIKYLLKYCELMPFSEVRDVEICFLDNLNQGTFLYNENYIRECHEIVNGKFGLVAVIHPNMVDLDKWNPEVIKLFRTVRLMINGPINAHTEDIIDYLHNFGVEVSINIIYITRKTEEFVAECLEISRKHNVERFCIADSCGGITPVGVMHWVNYVRSISKTIALNFHFHDHFNLAIANAVTCFDDVDIMDASVYGLGKGGGNLNLEDTIYAIRKTKGLAITQINVVKYAELLKYLMKEILEEDWEKALDDYKNLLIAVFDRNLKEIAIIEDEAGNDIMKFFSLISEGK